MFQSLTWETDYTYPDDAQVGTRVTRSRWGAREDQSHQVLVIPRRGPDSPGPGKTQVELSHLVWVRPRWGHSHQVQVRPN